MVATHPAASELIEQLALQPHPEGGWYSEIYRSATRVAGPNGARSALTTIYYLLEQGQLSRWHVVQADELWHFHAGAPLELFDYDPAARKLSRHVLAPVGSAGCTPVAVIPARAWQAARSLGAYTLVGCTVGPGFEFADFQFTCELPDHRAHFSGELAPLVSLL
jgi:predicted cupin superfamily sugar epimerase